MSIKSLFINCVIIIVLVLSCNKDDENFPLPSTQSKFSINISNNSIAPAQAEFINQSVNATDYLWKFGTGDSLYTTSKDTIIYTYENPGTYYASLTVTSSNPNLHYNNLYFEKKITINDKPVKRLFFTDRVENKVKYIIIDEQSAPVIEEFSSATLNKPYGMDIDTTNGKIYVTDYAEQLLNRFNWDGSGQEILMNQATENFNSPLGIIIIDNNIYWCEPGGIHKANIDGSEPELYIPVPGEYPQDLCYDHINQTIFFTNNLGLETGGVWKVNLNGSGLTKIIEDIWGGAIEVDPDNNRLYFYAGYEGMYLCDLNGENKTLFDSSNAGKWAWGMAIDKDSGKIYYPNRVDMTIMRANLDGSNVEVFIPSTANINPNAMAIDTYR